MRAIICTKYGTPEVLQIQNVAKPVVRNDDVLIKIMSTAVNSGDVRVRGLAAQGLMKIIMRFAIGFTKPRKPILGTVFSGIIVQMGKDVSKFKVGDEVFGMTGFKFGTYAEYISVNENGNLMLKPRNASFDEAAAIIFGGQTAIYFLEKAGISKRNKPKILIYGATGSVGSSAVQIANHFGADVTAVCSSDSLGFVKNLNANKIIFYDKEDFTTHQMKFDIVFDAVGKINKKHISNFLNKQGVYKTVAGWDFASEKKEQLALLKKLFEQGTYSALIDKIFSMDNVVEAHRYVDSQRKKGNVVLKISK